MGLEIFMGLFRHVRVIEIFFGFVSPSSAVILGLGLTARPGLYLGFRTTSAHSTAAVVSTVTPTSSEP